MRKNFLLPIFIVCMSAMAWAQKPTLKHLDTYNTNLFDESAAEIVVYDPDNNQLYFTNADANAVTILDFSDPENLSFIKDIDCEPYGDGINSVSYHDGHIAVAVEAENTGEQGSVIFFDKDGNYVADVKVGFLPDMLTFTPDGSKVVVANEGEPSDDYRIDPKGSVSVIDISGGVSNAEQGDVTDIDFMKFNGNLPEGVRVFGPNLYWNDDFEFTDDSIKQYSVINYGSIDTIFFDDFENTNDSLKNYLTVNEYSEETWYYDDFRGDHFAEANGFGDDTASRDWLVTPSMDVTGYEKVWFSFASARNFSGGDFSIWVSNNYDGNGDPTTATWNEITDMAMLSQGGYNEVQSGSIDITNYGGANTYIAFLYESDGTGPGDGALYQIDDLLVRGMNSYEGNPWYYSDRNGDHYAEANGFSGNGPSNSWLITPKLNIEHFTKPYVSFSNIKNFSGGSLEILISNDYMGGADPASATWDTLTGFASLSAGGYAEENSGKIDISDWASNNVYIAAHYKGNPGGGNSTLWRIDDLMVGTDSLSAAHNLEPEYAVISDDSKTAYVACQENNALAIVDLENLEITSILPLGTKDHSIAGNGLDASNRDDAINITTYPVNGFYLPDAIAYKTIMGTPYLLSANEGDAREYIWDTDSEGDCLRSGAMEFDDGECIAYTDETRVEDLNLDATAFPNAATLQLEENLGRLKTTLANGDNDGDGEWEEIYSYGARSFSIWDAATGALVFDSGDEFAQKAAELFPEGFNANNDENGSDSRSDDKGTEPEAITTGEYEDSVYAFIGLERMGGIMVYNINDPANARYVEYTTNRDFSDTVDIEKPWAGDLGPECLVYIQGEGLTQNYLVVANEVSGSVSVYQFGDIFTSVNTESVSAEWNVYPNPSTDGFFRVSKNGSFRVINAHGAEVANFNNTNRIDISQLPAGTYMIQDEQGTMKMVLKY